MIKILIYEDNKDLREGLTLLLNSVTDFKVIGSLKNCNNIEQDIELFTPDLILMDIEMPGIGGIEGLKRARAAKSLVKILMLTVFEDNDKVFEALRAGADGYILKKTPTLKIIDFIKDAFEGGAPMTPSVARQVLQSFVYQNPADEQSIEMITDREREVLRLLVNGYSYKLVASELYISLDTVRSHIKKIYEKLRVNSKSEAVVKALKRGLIH